MSDEQRRAEGTKASRLRRFAGKDPTSVTGLITLSAFCAWMLSPPRAAQSETICQSLAVKYSENPDAARNHELRALAACIEVLLAERTGLGSAARTDGQSRAARLPARPPTRITREQRNKVSVGPAFDPDAQIEYLCLEPRDFVGLDRRGARVEIRVNKFPGRDRY